jgi:hypothetical protein
MAIIRATEQNAKTAIAVLKIDFLLVIGEV